MSVRRRRQVASILQEELSLIIQRELKDPRLGFASITRVDVSPDIRYARVFVSVFGSVDEQESTIEALNHARGYIRKLVGPRLTLRFIPNFSFVLDNSMEHAERIARLLNDVQDDLQPEPSGASGAETDERSTA
jgi:ribosome-binding factor A